MTARIFCVSTSATQSGPGSDKPWRLTYEPETARQIDPLMGWTSSSDMKAQIRLSFATRDEAVAYAERNGLAYQVSEPAEASKTRRLVSYSDNFKTTRIGQWTH